MATGLPAESRAIEEGCGICHAQGDSRGTVLRRDLDQSRQTPEERRNVLRDRFARSDANQDGPERKTGTLCGEAGVELKVDAYPWKTIRGKVAEVHPVVFAKDLPSALSARRSGDVATGMDAKGQEIPLERTLEARVDVDNSERLLHPGMSGRGAFPTGRHFGVNWSCNRCSI